MNVYLWQNRPLIVLVPDVEDEFFVAQRKALAGRSADLVDRDMVVIEVVGDNVAVDGRPPPKLTAEYLRGRFESQTGLAEAILVGKDGGIKLRRSSPVPAETLFATIDAMPMRRHEMQSGY